MTMTYAELVEMFYALPAAVRDSGRVPVPRDVYCSIEELRAANQAPHRYSESLVDEGHIENTLMLGVFWYAVP